MAVDKEKIINDEIINIKRTAPSLEGLQMVTCVPEQVRFQLCLTQYKQLSMCMQFPENYPHAPLLIELKSKTLGDKLLDRLTKICDVEAKKQVGQKQVLILLNFLKQFLVDNPLCACSEEISYIKKEMLGEEDELKLKQKMSHILLKVRKNKYYMHLKIYVPDDYPKQCVSTEIKDSNFPQLLRTNFQSQAEEISRKCVQPPLKRKPKDPPFVPQPSLQKVCQFLISDSVKRYPDEVCPLCRERCLPEDPQESSVKKSKQLIRVYCGHIFHFGCMDTYMNTPPFTGGKKCPSCENRIFHHQWKVTPELAEERWAHKEARRRELDEVVDFLE